MRRTNPRQGLDWALGACVLGFVLAGCAGEGGAPPDELGYAGTGIAVQIAPLDLPSVTEACYSFELLSGGGERVVARGQAVSGPVAGLGDGGGPEGTSGAEASPLCSSRLGNARGALSYVAPCDATQPLHTLRLWVSSVCAGGSGWVDVEDGGTCAPLLGFVNPCGLEGCAVTATCVENADVPVVFNLTVMASAQQGFFDVAVSFDSIFCAAKVDCVDGEGAPLSMLHHPTTGARGDTVVMALACTGGPGGSETVLLRDEVTITCADGEVSLDPSLPVSGEGLVYGVAGPDPDPTDALWQYATYYGEESLACGQGPCNKRYWNLALGYSPGPLRPLSTSCSLRATATAGSSESLEAFSTPEATTWPLITVDLPLTDADRTLTCSRHPLNGQPEGVGTVFTDLETPHIFSFRFDGDGLSGASPALPPTWSDGLIVSLDAGDPASYAAPAATTWVDLSPAGNDATLVGSPAFGAADGGHLTFNGNNYGNLGSVSYDRAAFSVFVWVRMNQHHSSWSGGAVAKWFTGAGTANNEFFLGATTSTGPSPFGSAVQTSAGVVSVSDTVSYQVGRWYQLGLIWAEGTLRLYRDGLEVASASSAGTVPTTAQPMSLATFNNLNQYRARISLGVVTMHDRALSADEVAQSFEALRGRFGL